MDMKRIVRVYRKLLCTVASTVSSLSEHMNGAICTSRCNER